MGKTKIEWSEVTWNPVLGCSKVSEGCRNCYAMSMSARIANAGRAKQMEGKELTPVEQAYQEVVPQDENGKYLPKWNNRITLVPERLNDPLRWQKPRMVFVNSMSDLFHPDVPFDFIDKVFAVMEFSKQHTFQVLTKRPERMAKYFESRSNDVLSYGWIPLKDGELMPLPNVWLGTSVEDQKSALERIPHLLNCPASVRFLSCEPLLKSVFLTVPTDSGVKTLSSLEDGIDWVIVGGESGPNARPMHPDWVRSLRDQCQNAGVAFFFKQWGAWKEGSDKSAIEDRVILNTGAEYGVGEINSNELPKERADKWNAARPTRVSKVGKGKAGRLLDGREYNEMPEV